MALQQFLCAFSLVTILGQGCLSQNAECGMGRVSRIVGGQDAIPGDWPWQIALYIDGFFQCGGSLITDQWVLTAAHCITSGDVNNAEVHLGVNNLNFDPNEETVKLEEVICHPAYDSNTYNNDICLLKLAVQVSFTDYIKPVCLAAEDSTFYDWDHTWVTGFGSMEMRSNTTLQEVDVPIVGNKRCQCYLPQFHITENMLCAGLDDGGKDSCQGDSGGPMVVHHENMTWVQAGVVSFGEGCARPLAPGVYTRVSQYQRWILDTVTGMTPGFVTYMSSGWDYDEFYTCFTTTYPPTTTDDSIFGSGENLSRFTHFISLSVAALLLHVFVERGGM
ncbi:serine protease 27-like [Xenentodon cancila]